MSLEAAEFQPEDERLDDLLGPPPGFEGCTGDSRLPQGVESRLADGFQLLSRRFTLSEIVVVQLLDQSLDLLVVEIDGGDGDERKH